MGSVITVRDLNKQYITYRRGESLLDTVKSLFIREKIVVDAVKSMSFDVSQGEIVGLLGENGAGKSTMIKMLTGVLYPTSGQVNVLGYVPFAQRKKYVKHIGAVFGQKSQLIWDIPPQDSFTLNRAIYDIPDAEYRKRLADMLEILGLQEVVQKPTRVLSLGERMKCEFVMAMLHNPQVVFLDEPTIGVDIMAKEAIHDFIRNRNSEGVTFILTTHDLEDIESLAQRVMIMNHGTKVFEDTLPGLRKYLGDKKTVHISLKNKVDGERLSQKQGITLLKKNSDREWELLIDHEKISMNDFISFISEWGELQDISIKEIGIGAVIKSIYKT